VNPDTDLAYPLNEFYEQPDVPLPAVARVESARIPEPYRSLLVHDRDMTPTLENAYQQTLALRLLKFRLRGDELSRQVTLVPEGGGSPVAFGTIRIHLQHFPAAAKQLVLENHQPLGTILRTQAIEHASRPHAYIRVTADAVINSALGLTAGGFLYGRRNIIRDGAENVLAQVIEILAPADGQLRLNSNGAKR